MALNISIKGNNETSEYQDALALKQIFEKSIPNDVNGEILIVCNATLFGQEVKDIDLIVIGKFEKYSCKIVSSARTGGKDDRQNLEEKERLVYINDFCFVIETKKHPAEEVQLNGLNLLVRYKNKFSDATNQSEKQKYSLNNYFKDRIKTIPYICNFIWLRNVSWESIKEMIGDNTNALRKHNILPSSFSIPFLFQLACVQRAPFNPIDKGTNKPKGYSSFSSTMRHEAIDFAQLESIFGLFLRVKSGSGHLTRRKIEQITSKLLDQQNYAQSIGEKLVIISGRAGTGKTVKLLRVACDLALNKGARSLILTYNHALVSDIKRTLALIEIPDGVDSYTVSISTLHKFFYELILGFGIANDPIDPEANVKYIRDFIKNYTTYLKELYDYIENGLIGNEDIQKLMKTRHETVAWDYILIDEAQDWGEMEKSVIFKIFGSEKVIIADGVDQLVRSQHKCNWTRGLKPEISFKKTSEKKGLRQEINLVNFVNSYAKHLGISWEIEPKQELIGGRIIISTKGYSKELHDKEFLACKEKQNAAYEMMFLVPPKLVSRVQSINKFNEPTENRAFSLADKFKDLGIQIWDGTNTDLRTQYPVELNQHRLLQYESCRGLEAWTVVCLELDEFIKYKMDTFVEEDLGEIAGLETFEEKRDRFVYLWSIIPLTRAIETLVITINNKESKVCGAFRKAYEMHPDFVQWID